MRRGSLAILTVSYVVIGSDPEEKLPGDCLSHQDEVCATILKKQRSGQLFVWLRRLNLLIYNIFRRCLWAFLLVALSCAGAWAEEDPYLSILSQEAKKVDGMSQSTPNGSEGPAVQEYGGLSTQAFEEDLRERYKGSYIFYQKLPTRTKEEIFQEYRDGASFDEIRQKIMDRFLHH
jgi:hypothetical protein